MSCSRRRIEAVLLASALLVVCPLVAGTTVLDVRLGDTFSGNIAVAGTDVVEARFAAAPGPTVTLAIQAAEGSTLKPTAVIKDATGAPIPSSSQTIHWLPVGNVVVHFGVPSTGLYTAEIGGTSGSGEFLAQLSGSPVDVPPATLSGRVTDAGTSDPIAGASVRVDGAAFASTDESGDYSGTLAAGHHEVTFEATGYAAASQSVSLDPGEALVLDVALTAVEIPPALETSVSGEPGFDAVVVATVEVALPPGASLESIAWTQVSGAPVAISGGNTDTATITLPAAAAFKNQLIHVLSEPPIGADELPPNVPVPPEEFPAGLQDRFQVVGVNPFALEETGLVMLAVEVVTTSGTATDEVEIPVPLPWKTATGLRNVPLGNPVLLQGKEQGSYDWVLHTPAGSQAVLLDPTTRNPYFTPDVPGLYEIDVTNGATPLTLQVFAGTWRGVIVDQDVDGRPVSDTACTLCHDGVAAADKFTPWEDTGHAEIFTDNLDTSTHYSASCLPCHTVGYDLEVVNNGVDDAEDYQDFLDAGLVNHPGDNWTTVLEDFPATARLSNVQCENCHGPQDSIGHGFAGPAGEPRVDLSADVCATCHGEPLRHARFQQWQLSAHANYELAIDEGTNGNCARCHTANGFLEWLPILQDDDPLTDPLANITVSWSEDETHPQTCVTCHDPHAPGTTSGDNTDVTVRIHGDTPPLIAGFQAFDVGAGAICLTCHNTRRGLRNDDIYAGLSTSDKARAPHGSAQGDVLMGQNAYFIEVGTPGGHGSDVEDTCVTCHMKATPPPDLLAYNEGGLNHTFYAERTICAECHSPYLKPDDVQDGVEALLEQVYDAIEENVISLFGELIDQGYTIDLNGAVQIADAADVQAALLVDANGSQAFTITLTSGTYGPTSVNNIHVRNAAQVSLGTLYQFADPALIKAAWNYLIVHSDGSLGVHNPFFASDSLIGARDALVAATAAAGGGGGAAQAASERAPRPRFEQRRQQWREIRPERRSSR